MRIYLLKILFPINKKFSKKINLLANKIFITNIQNNFSQIFFQNTKIVKTKII